MHFYGQDKLADIHSAIASSSQITFDVATSGVTGAYIIKDKQVPIAVFKDSAHDSLHSANAGWVSRLKRFFLNLIKRWWFHTACQDTSKGQSYVSDLLSFELYQKFKALGLNQITVPDTYVVYNIPIDGTSRKGALLRWVPDAVSLGRFRNFFKRLVAIPEKLTSTAFEQMAILDYITGNMDRKEGNMLVSDKGLHLIDNSWAFSPLQGEHFSSNQYKWGRFPALSQRTFSDESKAIIKQIYDGRFEYAKSVYEKFRQLKPPNETIELSYQRAMTMLHRIEMLSYMVCDKDCSFEALSLMRFEDQFLQENNTAKSCILSPHFIHDLTQERLGEDGVCKNEDASVATLTSAELQYAALYTPPTNSTTGIVRALETEIKRLNEKQFQRNFCGLWRERFQSKAKDVNREYARMKQQSAGNITTAVEDDLQKKEGLYQCLNRHTSFFFKFTPSALSTDTQSIIHLRESRATHAA
jgi:hypothetical protein